MAHLKLPYGMLDKYSWVGCFGNCWTVHGFRAEGLKNNPPNLFANYELNSRLTRLRYCKRTRKGS